MKSWLALLAICAFANAATSTLYALVLYENYQPYTQNMNYVGYITALNPKTGSVQNITKQDTYQGISVIDPQGVFYFGATYLISRTNITSKTNLYAGVLGSAPYISLSYDTRQNRLIVVGQVSGNQLISSLTFWPSKPGSSPTSGPFLGDANNFVSTSGVIDSKNQIYYWIETPQSNIVTLNSISVATPFGQVNSVQLQCNSQLNPLSMTFDSVRQKLMLYGGVYNTTKQMYTLYINTVDSTGKCNAVTTSLTYSQYVSTFGYDQVNQVLYVSVDSTLYTLNARTGAIVNTVTVANGLVPYSLNVMYN